jgi:hypothetical protein
MAAMKQYRIQHGEHGWINAYPSKEMMERALRRLNDEEGWRTGRYPWYRMEG